ncbi:MAG: single-stranded DNA-binding protein [Ruminococcus sp.]|nr:single-stranded DNA-binding protein [Ruminococcus sp.]
MLNKVIIMGRLTADPELRQTASGQNNCQFTVAVQRNFAGQNGDRQSDFINVVAWRQTAEFICRYFSKGSMICVEGELRSRTYDDKRYPEVRHYVTEVYASNVYFTGEKAQGGGQGGNYQQGGYGQPNYGDYGSPQQNFNSQSAPAQPSVSVGDLSDFEEVISDSDLPF